MSHQLRNHIMPVVLFGDRDWGATPGTSGLRVGSSLQDHVDNIHMPEFLGPGQCSPPNTIAPFNVYLFAVDKGLDSVH